MIMKFTFGIVTAGGEDHRINQIIDSIESNRIPEDSYEIIIVGPSDVNRSNTKVWNLQFERWGWITRKKNIIAEQSQFENLVLLHDYVAFKPNWYDTMCEFGNDWDVCMNRILNTDGKRFRDWIKVNSFEPFSIEFADYNSTEHIRGTYVSGTYFLVKKQYLLDNPLNENLCWGQGEDVEWSRKLNSTWNYRVNPKSVVYFLKAKHHFPASPE